MFELNNFDAIQIGLASPEQVRKWSRGEVKKPEQEEDFESFQIEGLQEDLVLDDFNDEH